MMTGLARKRKKNPHLPYRMIINANKYYFLRPLENNRSKAIPLGYVFESDRTASESLEVALKAYERALNDITARETVGWLVDEWQASQLGKYAASTCKKYRCYARFIKRTMGDYRIDEVRQSDIARLIDSHYADKPHTANALKSLLSTVFRYGIRRGLRDNNPTRDIENLVEPRRKRYITDDELRRILKAAPPMLGCLVGLAALTGQRISDLLTLEWSAVSDETVLLHEMEYVSELSDAGLLFYPSKTRKSTGKRVPIRISEQLRMMLIRAREIQTRPSIYVIRKPDGEPYSYQGAYKAFVRTVERAARAYLLECIEEEKKPRPGMFENLHFHDLKRKALTDADNQQLDAQSLGGHSSPGMTRRYLEDVEDAPHRLIEPPKMPFDNR
jgi:integrase